MDTFHLNLGRMRSQILTFTYDKFSSVQYAQNVHNGCVTRPLSDQWGRVRKTDEEPGTFRLMGVTQPSLKPPAGESLTLPHIFLWIQNSKIFSSHVTTAMCHDFRKSLLFQPWLCGRDNCSFMPPKGHLMWWPLKTINVWEANRL